MNPRIYRCDTEDILYLRDLAEKHHNGKQWYQSDTLSELSKDRCDEVRHKLLTYGFTHGGNNQIDLITDKGLTYLDQLDNPPPKDYWKQISVWFKSKWWSIPLFLIAISIPLIKSWIEIIAWIVSNISNGQVS